MLSILDLSKPWVMILGEPDKGRIITLSKTFIFTTSTLKTDDLIKRGRLLGTFSGKCM